MLTAKWVLRRNGSGHPLRFRVMRFENALPYETKPLSTFPLIIRYAPGFLSDDKASAGLE